MSDTTPDHTPENIRQAGEVPEGLQEGLDQARENAGIPTTSGDLAESGPAEGQTAATGEQGTEGVEGDQYDAMTKEALTDELRGRTDADGNALKVSGNVDELRTRLRNADQGVYE